MPFLPGGLPDGVLILGLTSQNYNLLMGASGMICAALVWIIFSKGL